MLECIEDLCSDESELLGFLQFYKLLKDEKNCSECKIKCNILKKRNKYIFTCRKCKRQYSTTPTGFFFHESKLNYKTVLQLIHFFLNNIKVVTVINLIKISEKTVIDWYNFLREVCVNEVINSNEKIGGVDKIVEVDDSFLGRRKYNKRSLAEDKWVVGGIERGTRKCFFVPISNRNSETLRAVLEEYIKPGTKVITDEWQGYKDLHVIDINHLKENHSINFVDAKIGVRTNSVEDEWSRIKEKIPKYGRYKNHFSSYLCQYVWQQQQEKGKMFENFLEAIVKQQHQKIHDNKSSSSGKEKGRKRKRKKSEESLELAKNEESLQRVQTTENLGIDIVEIDSSVGVKVICNILPPDSSKTLEDNHKEDTISNRLKFQESSLEHISSPTVHNPVHPSSFNELMCSQDCVNEFDSFGKSVSKRLNNIPRNNALKLRLKIEELVANFRLRKSPSTLNDSSVEVPPLCDENFIDVKMEITDDFLG